MEIYICEYFVGHCENDGFVMGALKLWETFKCARKNKMNNI